MFVRDLDTEITAGNILALVNYLPYGSKEDRNIGYGENGANLEPGDAFSLDILNIKQMAKSDLAAWKQEKASNAAALFIYMFTKIIGNTENVELSVIPSSTKDNLEHGVSKFCEALSQKTNIHFDRDTLKRTETIPKAATTGERDEGKNFETLEVTGNISGKTVLLVDDITTSGSSRNAAKQKLQEAGASIVFFLAIGQTLSHYAYATESIPCTLIAKHWDLFFSMILTPIKPPMNKASIVPSAEKNKALLFYKKSSELEQISTESMSEQSDDDQEETAKGSIELNK